MIGSTGALRRLDALRRLVPTHRAGPAARGALLSVLIMGLGTGIGFGIQILISRTLGAEGFGTYSYVLGLLNIARTVVTVSFDLAAVRFAGIYFTGADWPRFRGFITAARSSVALFSALGALLCGLAVVTLRERLRPGFFEPIIAGCVLLAPASLFTLEVALLQALRRVYESRLPNVVLRPILIASFLLLAIHILGLAPTATVALYANVLAVTISLAVSIWFMQALLPATAHQAKRIWNAREWSTFCVVNLAQSLFYLLLSQQADIVIVGSLINTREAGLYAAASQISTLILLGVSTVNQFVSPMLAEFNARRTDRQLKRLLARITILNVVLSLPLILALVTLGPFLLGLFGPAFVDAYPVLLVLSAGALVNALWGGLWGDLLTMTGLHNESAVIVVVVTSLNLALTLVLTPRFGMTGAACATTIAVLFRGFLVAAVVRRRMGFWPLLVIAHAAA